MLVALDGDDVAGFVHVGVAAPAAEEWHIQGEPGVIRFLSHRPGERAVGVGLLQAAEDWLREGTEPSASGRSFPAREPCISARPLRHEPQPALHRR